MHPPLINLDEHPKLFPQLNNPLPALANHILRVRLRDPKLLDVRGDEFRVLGLGDVVLYSLGDARDIGAGTADDDDVILFVGVAGFAANVDVRAHSCAEVGLIAHERVEGRAVWSDDDFVVLAGDREGLFGDVGCLRGESVHVSLDGVEGWFGGLRALVHE